MKYEKIPLLIMPLFIMSACSTATIYKGTYKERHEQMCNEKPAFCKYPNKNVRRDIDGRIYLGQ